MPRKQPQSPALFWIAMVGMLVAAGLFYFPLTQSVDLQAEVLQQEPPEQVTISQFDPEEHSNAIGEARIRAQLDLNMEFELTHEFKRKKRTAIMIALEPVDGSTGGPTPGVMLVYGELDDAKIDWLLQNKVGEGALGPIVELHGTTGEDDANWGPLVQEVFQDQGKPLAADPIILYPWFQPREQALTSLNPIGLLAIFGGMAAIFALLALRQGNRRRKWRAANPRVSAVDAALGAAGIDIPPVGADIDAVAPAAPQASALSVGQGGVFVTIAPYAPEMVDGSDGAVLMRKLLANGTGKAEAEVYSPEKPGLQAFEAIEQGTTAAEDAFARAEARTGSRADRLLGMAS